MAKGWTCNFNTEEDWRTRRLSTAKELEDNVSSPLTVAQSAYTDGDQVYRHDENEKG